MSKKLIDEKKSLTLDLVKEAIDNMKGACTIVYPMGLPPHDPIQGTVRYISGRNIFELKVSNCIKLNLTIVKI